ncbi:MAG: hypothetical protein IJP87_05900, partial [Campylobacter sp.]|nr:hypothetical protein [Campylobacter sp.]
MKTKHLFGRILSAVLILFGSTVFTYGDDDPLADYDNTHHLVINKTSPRPDEIPNSGLIPSDPNGDYLGVITYGGKGTRVGAFGGIRPTNPNGSTNNYYGENGKKQLIEFSNIDLHNAFDQTKGLDLRFGGYGTYVFGDMATAGNPIIKPMPGDIITADQNWIGGYINNGDISGAFNSSKDEIKLPKGVTKDDIVFARLYWFGHLYNGHGEVINNSFGEENCDANDKAEAAKRGAQCRRFPKKLNLPQIKGYHDVKLKIEDSKVYDIKRE